ncbi:MAG: tetratricopeptide repeat protein [Alphaproteobacteria bacterium]
METALNRATALHNRGLLAEAEELYRSILADDPDQPDSLALLGVLLGGKRLFPEAIHLLERAVFLDPATPLFRFHLGRVLSDAGDYSRASEALQEATARKPDFAEAWLALSHSAIREKNYELANRAAENAEQLMPDNLAAVLAHGLALDFLDREEEAVICFERATRIKPDYVPAWDMLGTTYQNLNRLDEAEAAMRKTLKIAGYDENAAEISEKEYSAHHWNLTLLELLRGNFRVGFDHYRARFGKNGWHQRLPYPPPLWCGEDVKDKKILIVGEQGLGDVLMMCRYGALLKARGATVVLMAHPSLLPLLALSDVANEVRSDTPEVRHDFDFQTSIFDLPYRFGTTLETIPANVPYLALPPADENTQLPDTKRLKIGVVWAGYPIHNADRRRSIPLSVFAELFREPHAQFFNLTRDLRPGDAELMARYAMIDLAPKLSDFLVTARLVNQLDLIITCDTSVAHLAGGMGKKVWLLLPFAPDWRWMTVREDSPWYPTMRLFRQRQKGDWREVIMRVSEGLKRMGP